MVPNLSAYALLSQQCRKLINRHFTLNDDRLYRLGRQISTVARHHDMQMRLAVMPQVDVAPSLMMNVKACPQKHL